MNIIIPMAGSGQRFSDVGYKDPKPLIMVRGKRVIEYICDMFDKKNDNFIFICNSEMYREQLHLPDILEGLVDNCTIKIIPPHKFGPVYSITTAALNISNDDSVIVSYCDVPIVWDYAKFKDFASNIDGCIISQTGFHPHSLSPTMFAYSKTDDDNRVLEIKEKACYTDNKFTEHASVGSYYFKTGELMFKYFYELIDSNINYNGEYYVTLVYNLLIRDGLDVFSYLCDYVLSLGTPEDVRNYEAWRTILDGVQVKDEADLLACYNYWSKYVNNIP